MNYNTLGDSELLHYLDLYSKDPLIRRLVTILATTRGGLITDLENAGMDPNTWQFESDWQSMYPGDYIIYLRRQLELAEEDYEDVKRHKEELEDECNRLKSRSILEFLKEVEREKSESQSLVREAMKTVKAFKDENQSLKEKIDMWGRMNQVRN